MPMNDELETWSQKCERKNSLYIIHFTMFLMTLGFSIVLTGIWPYLKKVQKTNIFNHFSFFSLLIFYFLFLSILIPCFFFI